MGLVERENPREKKLFRVCVCVCVYIYIYKTGSLMKSRRGTIKQKQKMMPTILVLTKPYENKSIEPWAFISIHYFKVVQYIVPR